MGPDPVLQIQREFGRYMNKMLIFQSFLRFFKSFFFFFRTSRTFRRRGHPDSTKSFYVLVKYFLCLQCSVNVSMAFPFRFTLLSYINQKMFMFTFFMSLVSNKVMPYDSCRLFSLKLFADWIIPVSTRVSTEYPFISCI